MCILRPGSPVKQAALLSAGIDLMNAKNYFIRSKNRFRMLQLCSKSMRSHAGCANEKERARTLGEGVVSVGTEEIFYTESNARQDVQDLLGQLRNKKKNKTKQAHSQCCYDKTA